MARTSARNVNPGLSHDARDKLLAALNWPYGQWKRSAEYQQAPMYFDACLEWYRQLSDDDHETVLTGRCRRQRAQGRRGKHRRQPAASAAVSVVIPDRDIWAAALLMVRRYKADAMHEAAARADRSGRRRRLPSC
jgi:hypothetical protein